jgi:cobalamin biosynthesis protein CobD/CbiB
MAEIRGLEELQKKLKAFEEPQSMPLNELLNPRFVSACSKYASAEELISASGVDISTDEKLAHKRSVLDEFLSKNTSYCSWPEMISAAVEEYMKAKWT